jgi:transcriptional antiterminator RfaH
MMRESAGKRWYVVQTRPCLEAKAAAHLERQGFEIYFPRYLKSRRHARRVETVAAPLFPRYMFVAIDMAVQRWRSIQSTIGVSQLVCRGDHPAEVPDAVIDSLRCGQDDRGFVQLERRNPFRLGEKIRVLDGVFSSYLGLFERMTDGERVAILLDMLGRKVRVVLDVDAIEAA